MKLRSALRRHVQKSLDLNKWLDLSMHGRHWNSTVQPYIYEHFYLCYTSRAILTWEWGNKHQHFKEQIFCHQLWKSEYSNILFTVFQIYILCQRGQLNPKTITICLENTNIWRNAKSSNTIVQLWLHIDFSCSITIIYPLMQENIFESFSCIKSFYPDQIFLSFDFYTGSVKT